jgi:hypothetical protein
VKDAPEGKKTTAVKKTISMPRPMFDEASRRCANMGYPTFSEYLQFLIRKDLEDRPSHSVIREEREKKRPSSQS